MKALFLDRDGVINVENEGTYILNRDEFKFYPGAKDAIIKARAHFDIILVVTNQRGIGRGLMTVEALNDIHNYIQEQLSQKGGKIEAFYFAPSIHSEDEHRKPNTGMAIAAKKDFPEIDFDKSVMIGNNLSDMQFGKSMGMYTVFLHTTKEKIDLPHPLIDQQFDSLSAWVSTL